MKNLILLVVAGILVGISMMLYFTDYQYPARVEMQEFLRDYYDPELVVDGVIGPKGNAATSLSRSSVDGVFFYERM